MRQVQRPLYQRRTLIPHSRGQNNPALRNLPPSRRNAEELIFTIEGTRWKITLSSSQANSIVASPLSLFLCDRV